MSESILNSFVPILRVYCRWTTENEPQANELQTAQQGLHLGYKITGLSIDKHRLYLGEDDI